MVDCAYCSRSAAWTKLPASAIALNVERCLSSMLFYPLPLFLGMVNTRLDNLSEKSNVLLRYFVLLNIAHTAMLVKREQTACTQKSGSTAWHLSCRKRKNMEEQWIYKRKWHSLPVAGRGSDGRPAWH